MQNCSKCGVDASVVGLPIHLPCRRVIQIETKQLLLDGKIEEAKKIITQDKFDQEWKEYMYGRLLSLPEIMRALQPIWCMREVDRRVALQAEEAVISSALAPILNKAELLIENGKIREAEIYILKQQLENPNIPLWEKYNTGLRQIISAEFRLPINYTHRKDWEKFDEIIKSKAIPVFIHATDQSNIESIKKHGGLYSKQAMEKFGIMPEYVSDGFSRSLDARHGIFDYIHLSIQMSPMMYVARKGGRKIIELLIDPRFIYAQETMFSDKNATDNEAIIGARLENFNGIDFEIASGRWLWETNEEKKLFQAEILVKSHIPLEFITIKPPEVALPFGF